ncbi:MAG: lipocalin family protein [Gammaproteobacteria bacterium]|nr:lipocalin family protein [Gammaproteobacteria bacterium]
MKPWSCLAIIGISMLSACTSAPPIRTVDHVDLERFMGDWYVIANIPTFVEEGAHNAVESYSLQDDGTIATTFTFNADDFDGELKRYNPRGFVRDRESNAVWGMQFIWPFKAEYRIIYLNDDYSQTIIGRSKRDYVWIMARKPTLADDDYDAMLALLVDEGYDISRIQKVPQRW